ncbi:M23 family metallopeptidase [Leifsonia sp. NPDC058292]|uniref:M23 family metallopeptidase n=1 Tax=Leifsonia sp. NPDC058292 TaxID=3346428 RepID=UPI0036D7EB5B
MTRRELRERERAAAAAATAAAVTAPADAVPPRIARTAQTPRLTTVARTSAPQRRTHKAAFSRGFSVLAMTFAATIAVATSVPAMALLTKDDVQAQAIQAQTSRSAQGVAQELVSQPGSTVASITRDGTEVTSAEQVVALSHMRIADTFTNNPRAAVQWPFPVGVPISDYYGARSAPTEGASTNHLGVDFAPGSGVPIQIIADGVVREVVNSDNGGCGVNVTIDHMIAGALVSSKYCHMAPGSVRVAVGQQVKVADIVGLVGNTGVSTGAHLHLEILLNGTEHTDPLAWLKTNAR